MEHFFEAEDFFANKKIPIKKYQSKTFPGLRIYFADMESQVINGYFCYGNNHPIVSSLETLVWEMDSSMGLLPDSLKSDVLRPTWQQHGADNALADRDQSCFVCSALGEVAFQGSFSCSLVMFQKLGDLLDAYGFPSGGKTKHDSDDEQASNMLQNVPGQSGDGEPSAAVTKDDMTPEGGQDQPPVEGDKNPKEGEELELDETASVSVSESEEGSDDENLDCEPYVSEDGWDFYVLSEAGEAAMAWEVVLSAIFPDTPAFWNRLMCRPHSEIVQETRDYFDNTYHPENLTVIITGTVLDRNFILNSLHNGAMLMTEARSESEPFTRPSSDPLPPRNGGGELQEIKFIPRNPSVKGSCTICFGWRGCLALDITTATALKVLTAFLAVRPFWIEFVTKQQISHRVTWCQLEYKEVISLISFHQIQNEENAGKVVDDAKRILRELTAGEGPWFNIEEIRTMTDRVGWHSIREYESNPFIMIATAISKTERYADGDPEHLTSRLDGRKIYEDLMTKPLEYWQDLFTTYFNPDETYISKIAPLIFTHPEVFKSTQLQLDEEIEEEDVDDRNSDDTDAHPNSVSSNEQKEKEKIIEEVEEAEERSRRRIANLLEDLYPIDEIKCPCESQSNQLASETEGIDESLGYLEEMMKHDPFPFGDYTNDVMEFEKDLGKCSTFLGQLKNSCLRSFPMSSYQSNCPDQQHPNFPLQDLPFHTYLEELDTPFNYMTFVFDTTHLNSDERKLLSPIVAAIGLMLIPRPPFLGSDDLEPSEFYPPSHILDAYVSLGLNGEMVQCISAQIISTSEHYEWTIGVFHHIMHKAICTPEFLKLALNESINALGTDLKTQSVESPNYEAFGAPEINFHAIVKEFYKEESNARIFVGRRRMDLLREFLMNLEEKPQEMTNLLNATWRKLVDEGKINVQIAAGKNFLASLDFPPIKPWKKFFGDRCPKPSEIHLTTPTDVVNESLPPGEGFLISVKDCRDSCLTTAIQVDPSNVTEFAKIRLTCHLLTMAQKWAWEYLEEDKNYYPALRLSTDHGNLLTLNLESSDVMGYLEIFKRMINPDWPWLNSLLTVTKLNVINDPPSSAAGAEFEINDALLRHLYHESPTYRLDLAMVSLQTGVDDIKKTIEKYFLKLFDPEECTYALLTCEDDREQLVSRLGVLGFKFKEIDITDLCSTL